MGVIRFGPSHVPSQEDPEAAIERVLQITAAEIEQWQANVSRLPRSVYCENGEHERLSNRIRVLASAV